MRETSLWLRYFASSLLLLPLLTGLLLLPRWLSLYWLDVAINVLLWACLASAWNIAAGLAGGLSLGHAAFLGVGAYSATLLFLRFGLSPWLGMFVGAGLAAGLGALLALLTLRLRGPFFVLATLAFGMVAHIMAVNWRGLTRGAAGLALPFRGGAANMLFAEFSSYWYLGLGLLLLIIGLNYAIVHAPLGYYLIALREDEDAARSLGVRVVRSKLIAVTISAALTALAGTFYAVFVQYIDPSSTTQFELSVQIALVAIVGGLGTIWGPSLGALIVVPLGEVLRARLGGGPSLLIYGSLLTVVVLAAPQGVWPALQALGRGLWRRVQRDA